jgi:hypothetical protein
MSDLTVDGAKLEAVVGDLLEQAVAAHEAGCDMLAMVLHAAAGSIVDAYEMHVESLSDGE